MDQRFPRHFGRSGLVGVHTYQPGRHRVNCCSNAVILAHLKAPLIRYVQAPDSERALAGGSGCHERVLLRWRVEACNASSLESVTFEFDRW